jgi:hypothetical protein
VAVRFTHFALFEGTLLSLHYYFVDTIVLMAIAFAGWRVARAGRWRRNTNGCSSNLARRLAA